RTRTCASTSAPGRSRATASGSHRRRRLRRRCRSEPPARPGAVRLMRMAHAPHVVLVVDDDAAVRDAMVVTLEAEGRRAIPGADGRAALDALLAARVEPCLIILDLLMPTMDGWEFREHQLREGRLASIPVVVVSSYANPGREATSMGVLAGLQKPIEAEEVA